MVVRADAGFEADAAALKGRTIGVQRATIHERFAAATFKDSRLVRYARQDEAFLRTRRVNQAGVSVIIVEQNARRCLQICDRAYVLDQGRNAHSGPGRELMDDPKVIELYLGTLAADVDAAREAGG